ncbi:Alcohol dehydrogenase superfamily, zinc-type [Cordyceps fumosorosea ARSEF 2679]|uniref:Alcohol dehydrogenase superfamily, zinc-type n=1 Tax=Cordyceps fumosorosea (strain ARSEF 2679) TaxID=1081104 RepID=A0A162MSW4_CORFA|nr:Alcohol dehydrogenase superfamily, zinc-type [Cordyceps fumosorosea ARSEF 2679]OAA69789.1 Alcohol dehydrogenase superfamily, zinc-type [Cordyceps fumosorosea ARSEF 2679]
MTTSKSSPAYTAKTTQTAIVQSDVAVPENTKAATGPLPLTISHAVPMPPLPPPPGHLLIRVLAAALNPNDFKMPTYLPDPGATAGCDYCGVVLAAASPFKEGDRVCGSLFAYNRARPRDGSFAQFAVVDARLALRVPAGWSDAQGAAMGGIGWTTAALALWGDSALALQGRPSRPLAEAESEPVLVYGGATASGTMASQLLKASGYRPIAVASPASAALARQYGAAGTASYQSASVAEDARQAATATGDGQIRHALDCITDADSHAACMGAIARRGGRYACLEVPDASWPGARKAVRAGVVMAYECTGHAVDYGAESAYTRAASPEAYALAVEAVAELQPLIDDGRVVPHPVRELRGGWEGILKGLEMLRGGQVRGEKLVVRIPQAS